MTPRPITIATNIFAVLVLLSIIGMTISVFSSLYFALFTAEGARVFACVVAFILNFLFMGFSCAVVGIIQQIKKEVENEAS